MWSSRSVQVSDADSGRSLDVPIDEVIKTGSSGNFEQVLIMIVLSVTRIN